MLRINRKFKDTTTELYQSGNNENQSTESLTTYSGHSRIPMPRETGYIWGRIETENRTGLCRSHDDIAKNN